MESVRIAFEQRVHLLPLEKVLPSKMLTAAVMDSAKYRRIAASVRQVGLVEPLVVAHIKGGGAYSLLDGHVRLSALKEQGATEARCIIADDDEAFTYNKRVNRLATIQEHYMIVRAIERGVSEEKLAKALNVDVDSIRQRRDLLNGINADVAELLKDKPVGIHAFQKLRKMKPIRQLEVAELMISANNYSSNYAKALLAMSKPSDLHRPQDFKKATGLSAEQMERLEREMATANNDYKEIEASYGDDLLLLVIAAGFFERILSRPAIEQFFASGHQEMLEGLRGIVAAVSLDETTAAAA
jgi:hypothetical protein